MRFSRQTGDQQVMANTLESVQGYLDRQTYVKHLPIYSADQLVSGTGSFQAVGSYGVSFRTGNGSTDVRWAIHRPEDWIRGTLNAEFLVQTSNVAGYTGNVTLSLDIVYYPVGSDASGAGTSMVSWSDTFPITTIPVNELTHIEVDGIQDVTTEEDGLIFIKGTRSTSTSNDYIHFFGVELYYTPWFER